MIIYHGSTNIVEKPQILPPNRTLDFGAGFYTTTSFEQAESWVRRKLTQTSNIGYVNIYNWDENFILKKNIFEKPNEQWIDFVMKNRTQKGFSHEYDVVLGPVANDRVYACFSLYEQGFIDKPTLILQLKTYDLVDQILFHTQKALQSLTFIEAKLIKS